jgi:hypothetical protein
LPTNEVFLVLLAEKPPRRVMHSSLIEALEPRRLMAAAPGTGLSATYFDNLDFTNPLVTRLEKKVYADFGVASPAPGIAATTYSVRWTGRVKP